MEFTGERFIPEKLKESNETYQEHIERYKFASKYVISNLIVLDAACGVGFGTFMLSEKAGKIFGIDVSQEAIEYAKKNYLNKNIEYKVMDVEKLFFKDNFFDLVISFETIEHIKNPEIFLAEIKRVLKKDGILIISTPNKDTAPKGKSVHVAYHVQEFNYQQISNLLDVFKEVDWFCQKMTYHNRAYKKIRLLIRFIKGNFRNKLTNYLEKSFSLKKLPGFLKILLYEFKYKFKVIKYEENNEFIKPTFFVCTCKNKK